MGKFKFTYEYCKAETQKLTHYRELQGTSLYQVLLKHPDWLKELTKDLIKSNIKPKGTYTYEYCKAETQKLIYYSELQGTTLYGVLQKHPNWLEEFTKHLIRKQKPFGYWLHNKERCRKEALKYKTRTEFLKGSPSAYNAMHQNGWESELCSHMKYVQLPNGYWKKNENEKKLLNAGKKYKTQKEWLENDPKTFRIAIKLPIFEECTKHMEYIYKPNGWWTYERCKEALLKYKTVQEILKSKDKQAYVRATKDGWTELFSHFILLRKPNGYYTLDQCKKDASIYSSRTEMIKKNSGLYRIININGWDDVCFAHMKRKMTLKQRHIYAFEFPDNYVYVGLTCQPERRKRVHLGLEDKNNPERRKKSSVYLHMIKTKLKPEFKQLTIDPIPEDEAPKKEKQWINEYKKNGWILLNKARAGSLGAMRTKWTLKYVNEIASKHTIREEFNKEIPPYVKKGLKDEGKWENIIAHMKKTRRYVDEWNYEDCKKAAQLCKSRSEFQKRFSGGKKFAERNNWLDEFFPIKNVQIEKRKKIRKKHENFNDCKREALKYKTRGDFYKNSSEYFRAAKRMGILDEICEHMKVKPLKLKPEILLEDIRETALQYKTRWEWGKNKPREYRIAYKNGWLDEVCSHMKPVTSQQLNPDIYTFETCLQEAKKYKYKTHFKSGSKYHYFTAKKMGWLDEICSHMVNKKCVKWDSKKKLQEEAYNYKHRSEFQKKCSGGFKAAKKMGILDELFPILYGKCYNI